MALQRKIKVKINAFFVREICEILNTHVLKKKKCGFQVKRKGETICFTVDCWRIFNSERTSARSDKLFKPASIKI